MQNITFLLVATIVTFFNFCYTETILFGRNNYVIDIDDDIGELDEGDIYVTSPMLITQKSCKKVNDEDYLLVGNAEWGIKYSELASFVEYNSYIDNSKPFTEMKLESCGDLPILVCRYITLPEKKYHNKDCLLFVPIHLKVDDKVFKIGILLSGTLFSPKEDSFFSPLSKDKQYLQVMLAFRTVTVFFLRENDDENYKFESYLKEAFSYPTIFPN